MRVSARKGDQGYVSDRRGIRIFLNGHAVTDCVCADEEAGEVVVLARDARGHFLSNGERITEVVKRGRVEVVRD